jgi:hypothetical protein
MKTIMIPQSKPVKLFGCKISRRLFEALFSPDIRIKSDPLLP